MANAWFRLYAEFAHDPKVQMMSESLQRRYIMLLCVRCNGDVTLQDEEVTFLLRISNDEWQETKAVFMSKNLIDERNLPTAWDKRQFASDSSAPRVAKHREKKKEECNVTVTPPEQNRTEQIQNRTEQKKPRAPRFDALAHLVEFGVDPNIASDWIKLRRAKRAEVTRTAIDGICNEAAKAGFSLDAALRECCSRGWAGFKADWIRPSPQAAPAFKSVADQRADTIAELTGKKRQESQQFLIEGESRHVA